MVTKLQKFLAVPEPDHHVWRLVVLVVVLAVIIGLIWAYLAFFAKPNQLITDTPITPNPTEEQIMQAFTDSIAPTTATTSLDIQESKDLIDSIAPRDNKIIKTINN